MAFARGPTCDWSQRDHAMDWGDQVERQGLAEGQEGMAVGSAQLPPGGMLSINGVPVLLSKLDETPKSSNCVVAGYGNRLKTPLEVSLELILHRLRIHGQGAWPLRVLVRRQQPHLVLRGRSLRHCVCMRTSLPRCRNRSLV